MLVAGRLSRQMHTCSCAVHEGAQNWSELDHPSSRPCHAQTWPPAHAKSRSAPSFLFGPRRQIQRCLLHAVRQGSFKIRQLESSAFSLAPISLSMTWPAFADRP